MRRRVHIGSDVFPQQVQAYALVAAAGAGHHAVPLPTVRQLCRTRALRVRYAVYMYAECIYYYICPLPVRFVGCT